MPLDHVMLSLDEVINRLGISKETLAALIAADAFPPAHFSVSRPISNSATWRRKDVDAATATLAAAGIAAALA